MNKLEIFNILSMDDLKRIWQKIPRKSENFFLWMKQVNNKKNIIT